MKHKADDRLFLEGAVNINNLPFLKYNDRGKVHAMVESHCEMEIRKDDQKVSETEPDLDPMDQ